MQLKRIEDMNLYEILNVEPSASQQEIRQAYSLSKSSYGHGALAYYGLIREDERQLLLERIEEAYRTLGSIRKRKKYDIRSFKNKSDSYEYVYFRNSTQKMLIEDGETPLGFWQRIRRIFFTG